MNTFCCSDIHFIWFSFSQLIYLFLHYAILKTIYWPTSSLSWSWWWPSHCCWRWNISNNRGIHQQMEVFPLLKCIISKIQWQRKCLLSWIRMGWLIEKCKCYKMNNFQVNIFSCFYFNIQYFSYSCFKFLIIFLAILGFCFIFTNTSNLFSWFKVVWKKCLFSWHENSLPCTHQPSYHNMFMPT
jgi:hypothetical protein